MITKIITLTTIGADAGPTFDLYSDVDNYTTPFETGISAVALLAGYQTSLIPDLIFSANNCLIAICWSGNIASDNSPA